RISASSDAMFAIIHLLATFIADLFKSPRGLEVENLFLRHQLNIALRGAPHCPRLSATFGVGSLSLAGYADWSDFRSIWTTWWVGDLAGALVITPAIVLWSTDPPRWLERRELFQSSLIYMATIVVGLVAFSPLLEQTPTRSSLAFLAILPLMWAALRRNQRDTATIALLLSCFAVWGTITNAGPFVRSSLNESFL